MLSASLSSVSIGAETKDLKVVIERNVPVPMRDGTILRADIHRPDHGGSYPVLVRRTPYRKEGNFDRFVKAGYIVISQNVRGRYESEGRFEPDLLLKTHDANDGYDTIEWAAGLTNSNGKVGTIGVSYDAFLQWRLAPLNPPSLVAMSASGIDARHMLQEMGAGTGGADTYWYVSITPDVRRRANRPGVHTSWEAMKLWKEGEKQKWMYFLPRLDVPKEVFEDADEAVKYLLKNPHVDPWKLNKGIKYIAIPNLEFAGWYDPGKGDLTLYKTIVKEGKTEIARMGSRIIIGPWTHGTYRRNYGNIDFGPEAAIDKIAIQIRWFDYWLKGKPNGFDKDSPVKLFVMGDNIWREEQHWPLKRTKEKILYLTSKGSANTPKGNGHLTDKIPHSIGIDRYEYNPRNPVPSLRIGYNQPIPTDRSPLVDRQDILVYVSESLNKRIEVTGNPIVELYAASSAPDTDWYIWLIDVSPEGLEREVSAGKIRARYREGIDKPKLIKPGQIVKYAIRMRPTSNAFLPGHRIRLDITSSDFPNYDRNHNIAVNPNADATMAIARQSIYHGSKHATRIILPWVPNPISKEEPTERKGTEPETKKQIYPLHQSAADGDIERINLLLSEGISINTQDHKKNTPLCRAVESSKMKVVQILVEAGADVNSGSWPPLCVAVDENNIAIAEYLIAQGANVNAPEGWTALQETPYIDNNIEMVKLLISNGADVNAGPFTALHAAASKGRVDIAKLLLQNGANINVEDSRNMTPLEHALSENRGDIAELLLERMTDSPSIDKRGLTSLHYAAAYGFQDIIESLLDKGAKIDGRDDIYDFTPLHYTARFGTIEVAEVLIAHGADIKAMDKWDYQPIHWAAYHDRPEIIKLLIAKGAYVNAKTSLGQTPLDLAKPRRNTVTIEVLRKHGAEGGRVQNATDVVSDKPYAVLERSNVRVVIVNNEPVNDKVLPEHRGGYSGVASLTHKKRDKNLFVPLYAGLNFEHIHDGTVKPREILFEPRQAPMQIKQVNKYTVELYQKPTPHWKLESWLRYQLLKDNTIEMTFECVPHARTFKNDYIGLFFASYIHQPESLDIHFLGHRNNEKNAKPRWIRGVTPAHGKFSTHLATNDHRSFTHDSDFPLTLVFNLSNYHYDEPWYYGVSHGIALVMMFRPCDNVRFSQSPSGAGKGNPAWDFQWFIPEYKIGQRYRFVMRAMYLPFESPKQLIKLTELHRKALNVNKDFDF